MCPFCDDDRDYIPPNAPIHNAPLYRHILHVQIDDNNKTAIPKESKGRRKRVPKPMFYESDLNNFKDKSLIDAVVDSFNVSKTEAKRLIKGSAITIKNNNGVIHTLLTNQTWLEYFNKEK